MASFNRVTLMGNLTRDPELKYTPNGTAVAKFGLAMNRQLQSGEEVTFVDVTVWDKQAESCQQYLSKGRLVLLEGRLRQEKWSTPEGDNRSKLIVVAERVTFLPSGSNGNGNGAKAAESQGASTAAPAGEEVPF